MAKTKESFDKLLAVMAHEIKAPLSSVISLLDTIHKGYLDNDINKSKELVGRASKKSKILIKMLDDILDYSLVSNREKIKMEEIEIFNIISESVNLMKSFADEKNIRIKIDDKFKKNERVWGNLTFLLRVFNNLIMNAIKYNKENGTINIKYCLKKKLNEIEIIVNDTGIGMDEEDVKKVFNVLERGKNAKKNIDGSIGLGMSLVKEIVNSHRGSISVASKLNKGTTITILLPIFDGTIPKQDSHFCKI